MGSTKKKWLPLTNCSHEIKSLRTANTWNVAHNFTEYKSEGSASKLTVCNCRVRNRK